MSPTSKSHTEKETRKEKQRRVRKIIQILDHTYPDTTLALDFSTPLELLIALILAAQCTDILVNQVTAPLFKKYRTPQDWVALDHATLEAEIRKVTFFRNKAKAIHSCCRELMNRFGGAVPESLEELVSLPGRGTENRECSQRQRLRAPCHWRRSPCGANITAPWIHDRNQRRQNRIRSESACARQE